VNPTVAKQNYGSPRTYSTPARLASAIMRSGAKAASVDEAKRLVRVEWPAGIVEYRYDRAGNVDPQLAWDMDPERVS